MIRRMFGLGVGVVSLLALGAVIGIAADRYHHGQSIGDFDVRELHSDAVERLHGLLELDDDQVAAIDSVLRSRQVTVENAWRSLHQNVHSAVDTVHEEIMSLLRPHQREAFERWLRGEDGPHEAPH